METYWIIIIIYLIGIPITFAIIENNNKDKAFNLLNSVSWPINILEFICIITLYPIYWLTRKLINFLKHIKWLKM